MQEEPKKIAATAPNENGASLERRRPAPLKEVEPESRIPHIGFRGYLRLSRVLFIFLLFGLRVFINTRGWFGRKKVEPGLLRHREGAALRNKLLSLGPTFIKIGQTLATRADILPVEYIQELSKLQDEVPPFPTDQARAIIEHELRAKIDDVFSSFEDTPVAAASLGQVHRATLKAGQVVAVKVQRPDIAGKIDFDIKV
ncbi:MAG TPA: AarF/UbiB family protein, partial [Blastocatellia bacterium]|nr:AarF/UbiB family protein [Blastocatellia bacterium]